MLRSFKVITVRSNTVVHWCGRFSLDKCVGWSDRGLAVPGASPASAACMWGRSVVPWVRSQRGQGRAKAEGWSPSVSQVHVKVAITQDWLAMEPLAPWLFLSFPPPSPPQPLVFSLFDLNPSLSISSVSLFLSPLLTEVYWFCHIALFLSLNVLFLFSYSSAFTQIASIDRTVKTRSVRGNTQTLTTILLSWQRDAGGRGDHYSAHPFRSASSGFSASCTEDIYIYVADLGSWN